MVEGRPTGGGRLAHGWRAAPRIELRPIQKERVCRWEVVPGMVGGRPRDRNRCPMDDEVLSLICKRRFTGRVSPPSIVESIMRMGWEAVPWTKGNPATC